MNFDTVLLPLPLEGVDDHVLHEVGRFCRTCGGTVTLLHAYTMPAWYSPQSGSRDDYRQAVERAWRNTVEHAARRLSDDDVALGEAVLRQGAARDVICEYADETEADAIVLTRRSGGLPVLGRTSKRVLRRSGRHVLVIPPAAGEDGSSHADREGPWATLVAPTDFSHPAQWGVAQAMAIAASAGAAVVVAYVVEEIPSTAMSLMGEHITLNSAPLRESFAASVLKRLADAEDAGATAKVLFGRPADALLDEAKEDGADAIVVVSVGAGAMRRVLLGSTVERLARRSAVPVLVLRPSDESDED